LPRPPAGTCAFTLHGPAPGSEATSPDDTTTPAGTAIPAARNSALAEIEGVAADAARDIVARVAGANVEPAAAQAAVKEVMAHG
jgi:F-type H+-transporting ATPase subunit b